MSWVNSAIAATLPYVPKPLVWRISRRYIAGEHLDSALATVDELHRQGAAATLDLLGEDVTTPEQVAKCHQAYSQALERLGPAGLDCGVSIKLSEMGLRFDPGLCREVMEDIVADAERRGLFVRIDMEDSSVTDATLAVYREMRARHPGVGAVIQAALRRSPEDVAALLDEGIAHVRLCKGIYIEPESIAHRSPGAIHDAFRGLLRQLLEGGAENVGIATHHPELVDSARDMLVELGVSTDRYEFQMLLGVAEGLRRELIDQGHPLRVYVPYGQHWFAYSTRRLRENPAVAGHVLRNLFSRR